MRIASSLAVCAARDDRIQFTALLLYRAEIISLPQLISCQTSGAFSAWAPPLAAALGLQLVYLPAPSILLPLLRLPPVLFVLASVWVRLLSFWPFSPVASPQLPLPCRPIQ